MKKILSILIIFSLFLSSCAKEEVLEKKYYKTYEVWEWYISSKSSMLETVVWINITDLSFKNPWRIKEIFVKKWDIVKKWQFLATLTNEEGNINYAGSLNILNEIQNMWIDISSMWNDTKKIKSSISNLYDSKIAFLENEVEKSKLWISLAQKDLDLAKSDYVNTSKTLSWTNLSNQQKIKQAENALNMAKNNLENSKKLLESNKINIQKNAVNSLTNAYIIAKNGRDYVDNILWVTDLNKAKNDDFEQYLWAKKIITKTTAETSFAVFNKSYEETYILYQNNIVWKTDIPKDVLLNILNKALITLENLRTNLHDTSEVLNNSISSMTFSESMINEMKNQISTLLTNLEQSILSQTWAWIKWSIENIESFDNDYNLKIKQLEDSINISEQDLILAKTWKDINLSDIAKNIAGLKTNISVKEDNLDISKIWKEESIKNIELTKQEKIAKLAEIDANLWEIQSKLSEVNAKKAEVQMNSNLAKNSIESWIIKAPFDGIIVDKYFDLGTVVWAWIPIMKLSSNDWKFIKTYIDNNYYSFSKLSEINMKSEKDQRIFTWTVVNIDKIQDLTTKKNYIEIEIKDKETQIWDRLKLILWKEKKQKQIIIPLNSIINKYSEPWIFVLENGYAKFKIIKLKESDENFVAVEWIKIWEKIITDWKDNIIDWEKLE